MYIYFSTLQSSLNCSYCKANETIALIPTGLQGTSYGPYYLRILFSVLSISLLLQYLQRPSSRGFAFSTGVRETKTFGITLKVELKSNLSKSDAEQFFPHPSPFAQQLLN